MADDFVKIEVDDKALQEAFRKAPAKTKALLKDGLQQAALLVQNDSKRNAPYMTGNLRRSITNKIESLSAKIGTDLVYGRIQEFGGTITPKKSKYLTFKINGRWVRTTMSKIPPYKGKGYLRPALQSNRGKITEIFAKKLKTILA